MRITFEVSDGFAVCEQYEYSKKTVQAMIEQDRQVAKHIAQKLGIEPKWGINMGLTEGHWFEDEEQLTERQLERAVADEKAAYERGLRDGGAKTGWITTKYVRTFPVAGNYVLLATSDRRVISGYYAGYNGAHYVWKNSRNGFVFWDDEITHWMPLPEPPKDGV